MPTGMDKMSKIASYKLMARINTSLRYVSLDDYPGYCYFALLPDGAVKIGYSNTRKLVDERMKSLSRQYGAPVIPLAVVRGGWVAEIYHHDMFSEYRFPGDGERFAYSAEMAHYIAGLSS